MSTGAAWLTGPVSTGVFTLNKNTEGEFEPQGQVGFPDDLYKKWVSRTVEEAYKNNATRMQDIVADFLAQRATYHTILLPMKQSDVMVIEWWKYQSNHTSLDRVSENVPPRYIELTKSRHAVRLGHYSQGFEVNEEALHTAEGMEDMRRLEQLLRENTRQTMNTIITETLLSAPNFFRMHERYYGERKAGLIDVIKGEVEDFCPLSIDEHGLLKMMEKELSRTRGYHDPPQITDIVVPFGTQAWLAFGKGAEYHLEASRAGEDRVKEVTALGPRAFETIGGMRVHEQRDVHDTKRATVDSPFRKITVLSTFAVLDGNVPGKPNRAGISEPEIQLITLPRDDWQTFGISQLLDHCERFGENGLPKVPSSGSDPFLWGEGFPVKFFGDVEPQYVPTNWRPDMAMRVAQSMLTPGEMELFNLFLQRVDEVYRAMPSDTTTPGNDKSLDPFKTADTLPKWMMKNGADLSADSAPEYVASITTDKRDPTWGGPALKEDVMSADGGYPWFLGSIPGLMAFLRVKVTVTNRGHVHPSFLNMSYAAVNDVLTKVARGLNGVFPECPLFRPSACPPQFATNNRDTDAKIATIVNTFEHTKYAWYLTKAGVAAATAEKGFGGAGNVHENPTLDAFESQAADIVRKFDEIVAEGRYKTLKDYLDRWSITTGVAAEKRVALLKRTQFVKFIAPALATNDDWRATLTVAAINALWDMADKTEDLEAEPQLAQDLTAISVFAGNAATLVGQAVDGGTTYRLLPEDPRRPGTIHGIGDGTFPHARAEIADIGDAIVGAEEQTHVAPVALRNDVNGPYAFVHDGTAGQRTNNIEAQREAHAYSNRLVGGIIKAFLSTPFRKDTIKTMVKAGCPAPLNLMIINPFIRLQTDCMLMAQAGDQLGNLGYYLPHNAFQYDGHIKKHEDHFTIFMAGFVRDPSRMLIKEDAKLSGYLSGLSDQFMHPEQYPSQMNGMWMGRSESLIVCDLPLTEDRDTLLTKMSPGFLMGKPDPTMFDYNYMTDKEQVLSPNNVNWSTYDFYNEQYAFGSVNEGRVYLDGTYMDMRDNEWVPGVLLHRATRQYNPLSGRYEVDYHGQSHLDRIGHPPIKSTLDGHITFGSRRPFE